MAKKLIKRASKTGFIVGSIILVILAIYFLFFSPKHYNYKKITGLMATEIDLHIIAYPYQDANKIKDGLINELKRLENIFSSYKPNSELSIVNKKAFKNDVKLSNELYSVIVKAISYSNLSNGFFDISILPLISLWSGRDSVSEERIKSILPLVNYKNILLKDKSIRFLKSGMAISLGAIAKGFIIDRGMDYLKQQGIKNAILNIGGDVKAIGKKLYNKKWTIAIKNPRVELIPRDYIGYIPLEDMSLATSGDYEKYILNKSGKRLHHILNPKTGYPSDSNCISVSILAPSAMDADSIATIVFILGLDKGLRLIDSLDNVEGLIIYRDKNDIKWQSSSDIFITE